MHDISREGERLTVRVTGRLDAQTASSLQADLGPALGGITDITFDLDGLDYISSAGLRVLFAAYKLVNKRSGSMSVINVGEDVMSVFKLSGFDAIFGVE